MAAEDTPSMAKNRRTFRKRPQRTLVAGLLAVMVPSVAQADALPADIGRQLPPGYVPMTSNSSDFDKDGKLDYVVVVGREDEEALLAQGAAAPSRPLLVFLQAEKGRFLLASRNDAVVLAADEGGQCDPFMEGERLAVKGTFFTVQNSVACGQHWTDYITFRYSAEHRRFIFHKRIFESLIFNSSREPDAEALVPGRKVVTSGEQVKPVFLESYEFTP